MLALESCGATTTTTTASPPNAALRPTCTCEAKPQTAALAALSAWCGPGVLVVVSDECLVKRQMSHDREAIGVQGKASNNAMRGEDKWAAVDGA